MTDGLNKVLLLGNLGADPELRVTPGGNTRLVMRIATTESYEKEGVRKEQTTWHQIVVWGKRGEALAKILSKGSRVFVEGRIDNRSYDKDGVKKYVSEVVATDVWLTSGRPPGVATTNGFAPSFAAPAVQDEVPF